ncbi:hypothetical protein L228DRAFT_216932 [Xylona heveae TC161]|uniref:Dynamin-type G domain-containing protein n=1 Tax=Xylona heveae (strain CBS 132557 / TC161) TaxID=1328760 RepID=A0A165JWU1_XYLHT|nr:hypothetical protein L228DRAFT_216932 [Xylona heveae TC161]KZF26722.1 hypothetical protein L228DRAFT_216932 [Xylona heveae TC161]
MSQDPHSGGESSSAGGSSSNNDPASDLRAVVGQPRGSGRPGYMTVGSGATSAHAAALTAMLDNDSGYGGSIAGESSDAIGGWHPGITEDRPTPSRSPLGDPTAASENERRVLASHIHQLYYNQNRVALGRAINRTIETLKELQQMNTSWPAHYPSVQRTSSPARSPARSQTDPRPGIVHTHSTAGDFVHSSDPSAPRPGSLRRAATFAGDDAGDDDEAESSVSAEQRRASEPRLLSHQIAQEFSVLKIDLKLGALSQSELVHSLEKGSIASLLDGKIGHSIRHLLSLRDRIEDISSKVLVTGDLNAGKSTFCNALLRRKILPEDQQPCTSIFCEVLHARENGGVEEVHAVHKEMQYERHDESTYDVYALKQLEEIVIDNDRYSQCKVYVQDIRSVDESLLNNGVVDISIIDAPGLNNDSLKTTAVFARQEEIDVVVFVVSAANHFTLSAKEFIFNAAREKAYIFMVVNGFDNIRDKNRCQRMILEQVANLSPATFKESAELVHFVSSNAIPVAPGSSPNGGGGDNPSGNGPSGVPRDGDGGDDDDEEPKGKHGEPGSPPEEGKGKDKGKGKEREKIEDFENLEAALRRFVLEKRARSKLAPARTYLLNILGDLHTLANVNRDVAQSELDRMTKQLNELEPEFEKSKRARSEVSDDIDRTIEQGCAEIYQQSRETISQTIARVAEQDLGVPYPGLFQAFQYAEDIQTAMLQQIQNSVTSCEEAARGRTVQGVNTIKSLGILHLGEKYTDLTFRSDMMFTRKRDALARQVHTDVEVWDFFDISGLWERQEKVAGTSMAVTVVGVLGSRMIGGVGWIDGALGAARVLSRNDMRRLIVPGMFVAVVLGVSYALASIPQALPRRLSAKLSQTLAAMDYTHTNSNRIASEVRKVLRFPADNLRMGLEKNVENLGIRRDETEKIKRESEVARKYFSNLYRESRDLRRSVETVDLDGPAPGIAGGYDL